MKTAYSEHGGPFVSAQPPGDGQFGHVRPVEDLGDPDLEVLEVLSRRARGEASLPELVGALSGTRLLVPLIEVAAGGEVPGAPQPCASSERAMAVVGLGGAGGRRAVAFTGLAQMRAWRRDARPLPARVQEVARAAIPDGGGLLLDPASPHAVLVSGAALLRLATGEEWPQPWRDPLVAQAVGTELADILVAGMSVRLADPGPGADLQVLVTMPAPGGLPGPPDTEGAGRAIDPDLPDFAARIAARLISSELVGAVFEGLISVRVDPPAGALEGE